MEIVYSNHAKKRMEQRGIEEWEIEHLLKYPSYIKKTSESKKEAIGTIKNRFIKIVFIQEENYIKIITII